MIIPSGEEGSVFQRIEIHFEIDKRPHLIRRTLPLRRVLARPLM